MNTIKKTLVILTVASLVAAVVDPAFARDGRAACRRSGAARGWHPRRNEVMGRDGNIDRRIFRDRGQLNGNYKSLMNQDKSIRKQTATDFRANGGYLTKPQQRQLNKEENTLRKDIHQDYTGK